MPKWSRDEYNHWKTPKGMQLSRSQTGSGGYRGFGHNSKGISEHAEFFKDDGKRSLFGRLLSFATKSLILVLIGAAIFAIGAVLVTAILEGIAAGLAGISEKISAASEYLVIAASIVGAAAAVVVGFKIARSVNRQRERAFQRAERRQAAAIRRRTHVQDSQPAQLTYSQQTARPYSVAPASTTPMYSSGWYPDPFGSTQLRYWDGMAWTDHVRLMHAAASAVPGWYQDSSNVAWVRFWDGVSWTRNVKPMHPAVATAPGWYQDSLNAVQVRYWNGTCWTEHVAQRSVNVPARAPTGTIPSDESGTSTSDETRFKMTSAEWQVHVRAWMTAGTVEQELWHRLSHAQISDADELTLGAQQQMEQLSAEQGAQRLRLMLEANPGVRDDLDFTDFWASFLKNTISLAPTAPVRIERAGEIRLPRKPR